MTHETMIIASKHQMIMVLSSLSMIRHHPFDLHAFDVGDVGDYQAVLHAGAFDRRAVKCGAASGWVDDDHRVAGCWEFCPDQ